MRVENSSGSLLTRYRTKFRGFLGEAQIPPDLVVKFQTIDIVEVI